METTVYIYYDIEYLQNNRIHTDQPFTWFITRRQRRRWRCLPRYDRPIITIISINRHSHIPTHTHTQRRPTNVINKHVHALDFTSLCDCVAAGKHIRRIFTHTPRSHSFRANTKHSTHLTAAVGRPLGQIAAQSGRQIKRLGRLEQFLAAEHRCTRSKSHTFTHRETRTHSKRTNCTVMPVSNRLPLASNWLHATAVRIITKNASPVAGNLVARNYWRLLVRDRRGLLQLCRELTPPVEYISE